MDSQNDLAVIDAPLADPLVAYLDEHPEKKVRKVLLSHADKDHVAGLTALLTTHRVHVDEIHANPDPLRGTTVWRHFRKALRLAGKETILYPSLTSTTPGSLPHGAFTLQVISPLPHMALAGAGQDGQDSNSLSALVRVVREGRGEVLLTGDIGGLTLRHLLEDGPPDLTARVLVFPHHGGRPGGSYDPRKFTRDLTTLVNPQRVVFSIGRRSPARNPREDIVRGVRDAASGVHIACTQMSRNCTLEPDDLAGGNQCAGTIQISYPDGAILPSYDVHMAVIVAKADMTKALCQKFDSEAVSIVGTHDGSRSQLKSTQ